MASTQYYLSGIAKWVRVDKPDQFGNYSLNLCLDNESMQTFDQSGMKIRGNEDKEDGKTYHRFRRSQEAGAPIVVDSTGKPFTKIIGNGSEITIRVEVYDAKKFGKGHRLIAIRVDDWVEFKIDPEMVRARESIHLPPIEHGKAF